MRLALLIALFLAVSVLVACGPKGPYVDHHDDADWYAAPPAEPTPPPPMVPVICGEIRLSPDIAQMAPSRGWEGFVFVFGQSVNEAAPYVGIKLRIGAFPMKFCLSQKNVIVRGKAFTGAMLLTARIDGDGLPELDPGDFDGTTRALIPVGVQNVVVTIDTFR